MRDVVKALVVEDDPQIREEIEDVLATLGHEHDWAESQQEARERLENNGYHYVLADLEIPARTGRGFAKVEYGKQLVEQIQQLKGRCTLPVIVMTCHHRDGLNLAMDLLGKGAMEFISKPFGDAASGKSLSQVIQHVLKQHRQCFPEGTLPSDPPVPFKGGVLAYYPSHIELNGEIILEADGSGHSWPILQILRTPRTNGKLPKLSAPKLALAVDPTGQLGEGAIASCVHSLRERISNTMLEQANRVVGREDVITNRNRGYHLADWLTIEVHEATGVMSQDFGYQQSPPPDAALPLRQAWILRQVQSGVKIQRRMVEEQFSIGEKQAKRELATLTRLQLIRFIRKPRPGYYELASGACAGRLAESA